MNGSPASIRRFIPGNVGNDDGRIAGGLFELRTKLADNDLGHPQAEDFIRQHRLAVRCGGKDRRRAVVRHRFMPFMPIPDLARVMVAAA